MRKPIIQFELMPLCAMWIKPKYEKVKTIEQFIELGYECLTISENTPNPIKKAVYFKVFNLIYQTATNKSYQSKITA